MDPTKNSSKPRGPSRKRITLAILSAAALSMLSLIVLPATFGYFSSQTFNAGNSFTAGTLTMSNQACKNSQPVNAAGSLVACASNLADTIVTVGANMLPGDSRTGTVTITNTGSANAYMWLSESNVQPSFGVISFQNANSPFAPQANPAYNPSCNTANQFQAIYGYGCGNLANGSAGNGLKLLIQDITACLGANPPAGCANTLANDGFNGIPFQPATANGGLPLPGSLGGALWASGESHTYRFTVSLPTAADNSYQNTSASAQFNWTGTQTNTQ